MLPFRFYLITDRLHGRHAPRQWLARLAGAGLRAVQVREKDLAPAALFAFALELRDTVLRETVSSDTAILHTASRAAAGAPGRAAPESAPLQFFLNDRADLALALGFAGVQLREDSLPLARQAGLLRERLRFGVSTHTLEGVLAAEAAGAAFATLGPVFETASKAGYGPPVGLKLLERAAALSRLPLLALGGITPERVKPCREAGAWGVSAISAIWDAEDPLAALAAFGEALGGL